MKTETTKIEVKIEGAQLRSKQSVKSWNVFLNGELIGSVHGQTIEQARDTVAVFKNKGITVQPAN